MKNKKKSKFYDVHVNDGVNSFSVFLEINPISIPDKGKMSNEDIASYAADKGKLDVDDLGYVDNVTEIDEAEYKRAIKA